MHLHKGVTYRNFSSKQTNLRGIVILQLILQLKNVVALFIFYHIYYLNNKNNKIIYLYYC